MNNIISIQPTEKVFSITWMLGRRCNYDCMYCPPELHDKFSKHHDLLKLKEAWQNIHNQTAKKKLPYKIGFTGGEVTANKNFLPFVSWLKENYNIHSVLITTNGSAGLKYYEKLTNYVDAISFSTHTEFMNEKVFFEKVKVLNRLMIRPKKSFHVNIMDEYWAKERIKLYEKFCIENEISFSINEINYNKKNREEVLNNGQKNLKI
jgi:MoaA/NifB/PqqE/SkfB family radical SAM enzyme